MFFEQYEIIDILKTINDNFLLVVKVKYPIWRGTQLLNIEKHNVTDYLYFYFNAEGELLKETDIGNYKFLLSKQEKFEGFYVTYKPQAFISQRFNEYIEKNYNYTFKRISKKEEEYFLSKAKENMEIDINNNDCYNSFASYVDKLIPYDKGYCMEYKEATWYNDYMMGGIDSYNAIKVSYENSELNRFDPDFNIYLKCDKEGNVIISETVKEE